MDPLKIANTLANVIRGKRKVVYSDNWALMSKESLIYAAAYKLERVRHTDSPDKRLDDLIDAFNYVCFAIAREVGPTKQDLEEAIRKVIRHG